MNQRQSKSQPKWTDVKAKLTSFDRPALLGLIQDLYAAHKDNQTFLHARFGFGRNASPLQRNDGSLALAGRLQQAGSVRSKGQASHFQLQEGRRRPRRTSRVDGLLLRAGLRFCSDLGYQDESYLNALVRMFEQALIIATTLPASGRDALVARLDRVRTIGHKCGYGVGDDMDSMLAKHAQRKDRQSKRR